MDRAGWRTGLMLKLSRRPCYPAAWRRADADRVERAGSSEASSARRGAPAPCASGRRSGSWATRIAADRAPRQRRPRRPSRRTPSAPPPSCAASSIDRSMRRRLGVEAAAGTEQLRVDFAAPRIDDDGQLRGAVTSRVRLRPSPQGWKRRPLCAPVASANARAAATPMRVPVNVPGPTVTAMRSRSIEVEAALSAIASPIIGISRSAWPVSNRSHEEAERNDRTSPRRSATQTEQPSKQVSNARMFIGRHPIRRARRISPSEYEGRNVIRSSPFRRR